MPQRRADVEVEKSSQQGPGAVRLSKGYVAGFCGALSVEQNPVDGPCGPIVRFGPWRTALICIILHKLPKNVLPRGGVVSYSLTIAKYPNSSKALAKVQTPPSIDFLLLLTSSQHQN
ncbi:hypothetical protein ABVK25_007157 [Lepraria finkii]|uniref:Uncharacterized protein n=1 Tax=Lepraria finkii TaxID=1340010 RepID=A0ABR4B3Y1_9LECA